MDCKNYNHYLIVEDNVPAWLSSVFKIWDDVVLIFKGCFKVITPIHG